MATRKSILHNKTNQLGLSSISFSIMPILVFLLFFLTGCTTLSKSYSQTEFYDANKHEMSVDLAENSPASESIIKTHIWPTNETKLEFDVQQDLGRKPLRVPEEPKTAAFLIKPIRNEHSLQPLYSPTKNVSHHICASSDCRLEFSNPAYTGIQLSKTDSLTDKQTPDFSNDSLSRETESGREYGKKEAINMSKDWKGIGRDTAYLAGYQAVFAGVLYLMPKSISNWTDEQKRDTMNNWARNVQNPTFDKDSWWVNYLSHPYFGATYYIRARERGLGEFGSFAYSALLSGMYEFGIEAFFEQPSYQDLVVTPVGGMLIGKFIFEPIRKKIKSKKELVWSDHLFLILTDPLGAANSVVDKVLGVTSDVHFISPTITQMRPNQFIYQNTESTYRKNKRQQNLIGIQFDLNW